MIFMQHCFNLYPLYTLLDENGGRHEGSRATPELIRATSYLTKTIKRITLNEQTYD